MQRNYHTCGRIVIDGRGNEKDCVIEGGSLQYRAHNLTAQ
jgi:hypothetical protein